MVGRLDGTRVTGTVVACAVGTTVGEGDGAGEGAGVGDGDGDGAGGSDIAGVGDCTTEVAEGELVDGRTVGGGVPTGPGEQAAMTITVRSAWMVDRIMSS